jgi:hypothetical protein
MATSSGWARTPAVSRSIVGVVAPASVPAMACATSCRVNVAWESMSRSPRRRTNASGVTGRRSGFVVRPRSSSSCSGPHPAVVASCCQVSTRLSLSIKVLACRVARVACCAARGPDWPRRSSSVSISLRRFENRRKIRRGMPAISHESFTAGPHSTPSRTVSSWRSAAWKMTPAARWLR